MWTFIWVKSWTSFKGYHSHQTDWMTVWNYIKISFRKIRQKSGKKFSNLCRHFRLKELLLDCTSSCVSNITTAIEDWKFYEGIKEVSQDYPSHNCRLFNRDILQDYKSMFQTMFSRTVRPYVRNFLGRFFFFFPSFSRTQRDIFAIHQSPLKWRL